MEDETGSVVLTPYAENYDIGQDLGRLDYSWHCYQPPANGDAAMLAGYDAGWRLQEFIQTERLTEQPSTADEARFERELTYHEAMWS